MKNSSLFSLRFAGRLTALMALALGLTVLPAFAQHNGHFDEQDSFGGLFLGSSQNPHAWNIGVARIKGEASLDENDPDASAFDFSMASENSTLTFKSKRASLLRDNLWQVTGDLTISRVERSIQANAGEDYSGPVYGEPEVHAVTREATFVLAMLDDPALDSHAEILGSAAIGRENFPELLAGIFDDNWPAMAANSDCQMPGNIGDDYSGSQCRGKLIETRNNDGMYQSIGEDYAGVESATPDVNQLRIVLRLSLPAQSLVARAGN
jgi:hypothetical protein